MLYRQFPKIANKEISILGVSLAGTEDGARAAELLECAADRGINFLDTGSNPAQIEKLSALLGPEGNAGGFYRMYGFQGNTPAQLDAFLLLVGSRDDDFLLFPIADEAGLENTGKSGLLDAARKAKDAGRIGHYGFSCPADGALIVKAVDFHGDWDFYSIPFNYLHENLSPAILHASENELGLVASDPFEGGLLENPGNAVHEHFRNAPVPRSHGEWALRAIWEKQDVVTVVWEPADTDGLVRNSIFAEAGRPNSLPGKELSVLDNARKTLDINDQIQQS